MPLHPDLPNSSDLAKEREDYEELVRTPGWHRFVKAMEDRFTGAGFYHGISAAIASGEMANVVVTQKLADEAMRLVNFPFGRIRDLRGDTE